ncbi:MAG: hypothetical protein K6B44_09150 [Lachnospiraceae bacterium]|nr:hypothetical protein [Lachnospiraceae bacterium]
MIYIKDLERIIESYKEILDKVGREAEVLKKRCQSGGRLYSMRHGNTYQYFIRTKETDTHGEYIKKDKLKFAETLAQIEYDDKLAETLEKTVKTLDRLKKEWPEDPFVSAEKKLGAGKMELVKKVCITDEEYIRAWLDADYEMMGFRETEKDFYTRKGLRVRSKSELIIADMLDEEEIPFRYEKPLKLKAGTVHPDFTLLNIKERKEVYWEHFGMMDDIEYRNNAFIKIREYEDSGMYQYDSMIWTFETSKYPLNTKSLRGMIRSLRKELGYYAQRT